MKGSLLIDSGLPTKFCAEAIDNTNYLRNWLPTRRTKIVIIPEEAWIEVRQNLEHDRIFGSTINTYIPSEKRFKSDIYKTWSEIFIGYTNITKHLRVWAPKTFQMLIASKPIINESKRGFQLLIENPMPPPPKSFRQPASKPRPQGRQRKRPCIENENKAEKEGYVEVEAPNESRMRTEDPHNQIKKPRTDIGGTSGKNPHTEWLVRPVHEFAKLVAETSSKVQEPKTYDEAISDPIHGNRWRETIDEELWNLDLHQTWSYSTLPSRRKVIGCKWVLNVKYHPDGSIERYKSCLVTQGFSQVHVVD